MAQKKKTYEVVGPPVDVNGKTHHQGETFEATPGQVDFHLTTGGVKEVKSKD